MHCKIQMTLNLHIPSMISADWFNKTVLYVSKKCVNMCRLTDIQSESKQDIYTSLHKICQDLPKFRFL